MSTPARNTGGDSGEKHHSSQRQGDARTTTRRSNSKPTAGTGAQEQRQARAYQPSRHALEVDHALCISFLCPSDTFPKYPSSPSLPRVSHEILNGLRRHTVVNVGPYRLLNTSFKRDNFRALPPATYHD